MVAIQEVSLINGIEVLPEIEGVWHMPCFI
jgi:hypothetical protein